MIVTKAVLLVFALASPGVSRADDHPDEELLAIEAAGNRAQRVQMIIQDCIQAKFRDVKCSFDLKTQKLSGVAPKVAFNLSADEMLCRPINAVVSTMVDGAKLLSSSCSNLSSEIYWNSKSFLADYKCFVEALRNKARQEKLSDCQKACLATCVSSRIIDYAPVFYSSADRALTEEHGQCMQFADIATDTLVRLGLDARAEWGPSPGQKKHAMTSVRLGGERYLVNPQSESCTFFRMPKP